MEPSIDNYLALDQSLNVTGYAYFTTTPGIKLLGSGTFTIPKNKPMEARLAAFYKQITELIKDQNITHVFFEDIQYQNNKDTYKKLAFVQATILLWCYWNEIKYTILPPSHWRKILSDEYDIKFGRARAEQKKNCFDFITKKYHMSTENTTEDETDAIALGTAGILERKKNESNW